jgi:hypothetical protein
MSAPTVTKLPDLALQSERLWRFAKARESPRRANARDGGPATLQARRGLGGCGSARGRSPISPRPSASSP